MTNNPRFSRIIGAAGDRLSTRWRVRAAARASVCVPQIVEAMNQDSGVRLTQLQVDGGMTANQLLMQLQADILHIPVGEDTPLNTRLRHCSPAVVGVSNRLRSYLERLLADLRPGKRQRRLCPNRHASPPRTPTPDLLLFPPRRLLSQLRQTKHEP